MDEQKKYEVQGTVTISTEEYRDLITEKYEAQKEMEDYRHRYWDEQSKKRELESKVAALEKGQKNYRDFVNSTPECTALYKQWLINKQEEEAFE